MVVKSHQTVDFKDIRLAKSTVFDCPCGRNSQDALHRKDGIERESTDLANQVHEFQEYLRSHLGIL